MQVIEIITINRVYYFKLLTIYVLYQCYPYANHLQIERPWNVYSGKINRSFNVIVTPKVKEEVRNHFGCPDLEGAELEDQVSL